MLEIPTTVTPSVIAAEAATKSTGEFELPKDQYTWSPPPGELTFERVMNIFLHFPGNI
jgi:hypothetical protein